MKKTIRKITSVIIMLLTSTSVSLTGVAANIDSAVISGGKTVITLTGTAGESFNVYTAGYSDDGRMTGVSAEKVTMTGNVRAVTADVLGTGSAVYLWDDAQSPLSNAYAAETDTGFIAEFETDEHLSVTAYMTQDTSGAYEENAAYAVARSSADGTVDISGEGQINFMISAEDGYDVGSVTVTPSNYKNLKLVSPADNLYRITKITGDITVAITEKETSEAAGDGIIHLNGTSVDASGVDGVTVNGTMVTITNAGTYYIEGTLDDGQITVAAASKSDEIIVNLDNVSVSSSTVNPFNAATGKVTLINSGQSTFTAHADGAAAIYSKNDLTIKGADTLNAVSELGNGIRCKADLEIGSGDINVTAYNHGIKGDESIKITKKAGNITVNAANGDAIKTDAIDSETLELEYGKGNIYINGGVLDLNAAGDGIQADDTVTVTGGEINITSGTEGIKANTVNTPTTNETTGDISYVEGCVSISGGTILIDSVEDGIKGAGSIDISGGSITVDAQLDGIQSGIDYTDESNETQYSTGDLTISGGEINITTYGGASNTAADTSDSSHKGIKAINELIITGGTLTLDCYDDAIHSNWSAEITGGSFDIATGDDGMHADYMLTLGAPGGSAGDYTVNISTSYEGLEGSVINLLSGTVYVYATDDGVNAAGDYDEAGNLSSSGSLSGSGSTSRPGGPGGFGGRDPGMDDNSSNGMLYIKGGYLYVVSGGDGLDSNGDILMSDGVVIVNGPTSGGNGVFDKGDNNNTFKVTGGTLIGFGINDMTDNPSSVTNQGYYSSAGSSYGFGGRPGSSSSSFSITKGSPVKVTTDSGYIVIIPEITVSNAMLYVTCPQMSSGKTFTRSSISSYPDAALLFGKEINGTVYGAYQK